MDHTILNNTHPRAEGGGVEGGSFPPPPLDLLKNSLCISSKQLINVVKGYLPL